MNNKRLRFTIADDLILLKEIVSSDPFTDPSLWDTIRRNVAAVSKKNFTARAVKDHVQILLKNFLREDNKKRKRTGTQEQHGEIERLLQETSDLWKESLRRPAPPTDSIKEDILAGVEARNEGAMTIQAEIDVEHYQNLVGTNSDPVLFSEEEFGGELGDHESGALGGEDQIQENDNNNEQELPRPTYTTLRNMIVPDFNTSDNDSPLRLRGPDVRSEDDPLHLRDEEIRMNRGTDQCTSKISDDCRNERPLLSARSSCLVTRGRGGSVTKYNAALEIIRDRHAEERILKSRELMLEEKRLALDERKLELESRKFEVEAELNRKKLDMESKERESRLQADIQQRELLMALVKKVLDDK